ncbi:R-spondin-3 isoform X2 [Pogona vitticeps]
MQLRLVSWFFITLNLMEYIGSQQQPSRVRRQGRKCKADCEACFNKNFCMKCKNGFYLHHGKCLENCPDWLEPNNHTMECNEIVHCKVGEWSPWSTCMKKGKTCGFKRGNETRVKEILQLPSSKGKPCPDTNETRECVVQRKKCLREPGRGKERRRKPKREENKETSQENRGQESRRQNREQENKSKIRSKKRRTEDKQQKLASISTTP